jgi:very-long-chain ceramide synthase
LAPLFEPGISNPFAPFFLLSGLVPSSSRDDPRYAKSYLDLLFIAYYVVFWSFVRQSLTIYVSRPIARYFKIRKEAKIDRFGEQTYAFLYFLVVGAWGLVSVALPSNHVSSLAYQRIMSQLPTLWYRTEYFWIGRDLSSRTLHMINFGI